MRVIKIIRNEVSSLILPGRDATECVIGKYKGNFDRRLVPAYGDFI